MSSDARWQRIEEIFHGALDRPLPDRAAYLQMACGDDDTLRREVESLLAQGNATDFLTTPALELAGREMAEAPTVVIGRQIGSYQIVTLLGIGGMGEVYRARDTNLHRDVAIKLLPRALAHDPDRVSRFAREARLLAALSHPHIATIHGLEQIDGSTVLILELVEGDTLAERIARGPLSLDDALPLACQIAEALEAAHEQGIIHRDLKPANVKMTKGGSVKVLDFGLAKFAETAGGAIDAQVTAIGAVLGTPAYMSPEQANGSRADNRADIWAFGAVLYEMLTGRRAFEGTTQAEILGSVLKTEPNWNALPPGTPAVVRSLLHRCLQKDRNRRLRDIADARFQLEEASVDPVSALEGPGASRTPQTREWRWWTVTLILAVAAGSGWLFRAAREPDEVRLDITVPPTTEPTSIAIAPDGKTVAFVATVGGQPQLWLRSLDDATSKPLRGTRNASRPFWKPDSRSLGFFADGRLKRIDLDDETVRDLADRAWTGGTWNAEGTILFGGGAGRVLFRVSEDGGGTPTAVTQGVLRSAYHVSPQFLPDGRHFLFSALGVESGIYVGELDSADPPQFLIDADAAMYGPSGHLFFVRDGTLFAQRLNARTLEFADGVTTVAEQITTVQEPHAAALFVSAAGPIAYRTGEPASQFARFDRFGKELQVLAGSDVTSRSAALSSNRRHLALVDRSTGTPDISVLDIDRGVRSRFTFDTAFDLDPVWSPDDRHIAFASNRNGPFSLYVKRADRTGTEDLLHQAPGFSVSPTDWSSTGFILLTKLPGPEAATERGRADGDIWALRLPPSLSGVQPTSAATTPEAFGIVQTDFVEANGRFSANGKWIAYQANNDGPFEIYVQPFPSGPTTKISSGGGVQASWRQDGTELYYLSAEQQLIAVSITLDERRGVVEVGTPKVLFDVNLDPVPQNFAARQYIASADGQQFLVNTPKEVTLPITVILNWKTKP